MKNDTVLSAKKAKAFVRFFGQFPFQNHRSFCFGMNSLKDLPFATIFSSPMAQK
jgi:hypothetical protein